MYYQILPSKELIYVAYYMYVMAIFGCQLNYI